VRVNVNAEAIRRLVEDDVVVNLLGERAEQIRSKVSAPSQFTLHTRKGRARRGAFAQVVMRGSGSIAWEFGSRRNPPHAPLRSAMR
jgi:hypothetical protein